MRKIITGILAFVLLTALSTDANADPALTPAPERATPAGKAQATSLFGEPLYPGEPSKDMLRNFEVAKARYLADPANADKLIWYGRRTAYLGEYQRAIEIFSEGVKKHPRDARMLRHRGHRYISIRRFDKAVADLELALQMIEGTEDRIEPDGLPNARNIPLTTLHGNIRYHLGLAYYLTQEFEKARRIFSIDLKAADNDDGVVATTHWLYMTLRRMDRHAEATGLLQAISPDMEIIENHAYHRACLFYRGGLDRDQTMAEGDDGVSGAALAYAIANWRLYNGQKDEAFDMMNRIVDGTSWAAFGYIAAEADLAAFDARQ